MLWSVSRTDPRRAPGDLLVSVVARGGLGAVADLVGDAGLRRTLAGGGFAGEADTWLALPHPGARTSWLLVLGAGPSGEVSLDGWRRLAGLAAQRARAMKARRVVVAPVDGSVADFDAATLARCWVEGAELSGDDREDAAPSWRLIAADAAEAAALREGVRQGEAYAAGCRLARRLVNQPPNVLTPERLAREAQGVARDAGCACTVMGPEELSRRRMGGILAVGQGSRHAPRLIVLESRRAPRGAPTVALVGKGVTFDSGGISLKPAAKMEQMKSDMAGAAAVLGAVATVSRLDLPVRLLAVLPAAENMPDGRAVRPSDVITMASGATVEVVNTDAEGRLLLADALHFACRRRPAWVIDVATLTGACALALGPQFAGLLGTSGRLLEALEQAGGETFERVWPLPLVAAHREELTSPVADLRNVGGRDGGALTAASFLSAFVPDDVPWAHLDIAGTAWTEKAGPLGPRGGTGFGARLLARTVEILVG